MNAAYSAREVTVDGIAAAQLADTARQTTASVAPGIGNTAYEWSVGGRNYLYFPYKSLAEFAQRPRFCAIPFLAPWANRLDSDGFWANGKRYTLNPELGNIRRDGNQKPIHGMLSTSNLWKAVEVKADDRSAWATSRLEFWRHADLMAQFPFPHTLTMTYRLREGAVEVETSIENHAADPMPVGIGFHPYFRLHDTPRDQWHVHLAARDHLALNQHLIPTGERKPIEFADPHVLGSGQLDDVFGNLIRDSDGRARFHVEGGRERITVAYGPKYTVAVVYAPRGQEFICFEPMSAITNGFNLAHEGKYSELQSIAPGGTWRESFWMSVG
jgi:aldose 1-epimerase